MIVRNLLYKDGYNDIILLKILQEEIENKYPTFDITSQHLVQIVRDNNKTRKRTMREHFPKERYKKPIDKQTELNKFYSKVKQFPIRRKLKNYK